MTPYTQLTAQELGERIARARTQRNLSQRDLETKIGKTGVGQWERGRNFPALAHLFKIAEALNQPLAYFFGDGYIEKPQEQVIAQKVAELLQELLDVNSVSLVRENEGHITSTMPADQATLEKLADLLADRLADRIATRLADRLEKTIRHRPRAMPQGRDAASKPKKKTPPRHV